MTIFTAGQRVFSGKRINRIQSILTTSAKTIYTSYLHTPYGEMILGSIDDVLCLCDWRYRSRRQAIDTRIQTTLNASYQTGASEVNKLAATQLQEYFLKTRKAFSVPLHFAGSPFQEQVWQHLLQLPYGTTISYAGLSERLGNLAAVRAVAAANGANAISIFVPCHRVIGSNGELTGYAGGVRAKQQLLELEGALNHSSLSVSLLRLEV